MKLKIKLFATLRQFAPATAKDGEFSLEMPGARTTVQEVIDRCGLPDQVVMLVMVNGMVTAPSTEVEDGAEVSIFPPLSGG